MDPQATFENFYEAVSAGDYDAATEAEISYNRWIASGGFHAKDFDGARIIRLDLEQDRYLVADFGQEKWRSI